MGCFGSKCGSDAFFGNPLATSTPRTTSTSLNMVTESSSKTASTVSRTPLKLSGETPHQRWFSIYFMLFVLNLVFVIEWSNFHGQFLFLSSRLSELGTTSSNQHGEESSSRTSPIGINSPKFGRADTEESFQSQANKVSPEPSRSFLDKFKRSEPGSVKAVRKEAQHKRRAERVQMLTNGRRLSFEPTNQMTFPMTTTFNDGGEL